MHRDLKSPNILLASISPDADLVAKVCDFGVSLNSAQRTAGRIVDCPRTLLVPPPELRFVLCSSR
jgi:serine/threonine protein kinase